MTQSRPNVLIIYPDQMRYDCTGAGGNGVIHTPSIDRLADEGAFFENAYTSFPLCCPFRSSVMTGKYAHSTGMYANHYPIRLGQRWLADCFNDAGYRSGYVGKWHLNGGPKYAYVRPEYRCGFQRFIGFSRGHQYFDPIFYRDDDSTPRTSRKYEPDVQSEHLFEVMEDAVDEGRPFFAMICYGPPHPPLQMPDYYRNMYDPRKVPVRACTPEENREKARKFLARYYGLCTCVDDNVGRVIDWLDEKKLRDNTIVILVSDHGEMAGEFGRGGKKTYSDGAMHVPFIIRWPGVIADGQRVDTMVDPGVDIMPTVLDFCEIEVPDCVQGQSLARLVTEGDSSGLRDYVFYEVLMEKEGPEKFPVPERGIRTRDRLYVRQESGPTHLFELRADPLEMDNRADDPEYFERMTEMDRILADHMVETDDDWATEALFPPPNFMSHEEAPKYHTELLKRVVLEE